MASKSEPSLKPGGRNLLLLCLAGIVMALISTSISLIIYRNSGDIYIDRSRPGYISEDEVYDSDDTHISPAYSWELETVNLVKK